MHLEVLVEDVSGAKLIEAVLPKIIGDYGITNTWRVHPYRGIGRLPAGLSSKTDPSKRALLDHLPRLLCGYGRTPGIDAVLVILDSDRRDPITFLAELENILEHCQAPPVTQFHLAIEEMEAWMLGDRAALLTAYPRAKKDVLNRYRQDSICGTWETLADALYPGGSAAVQKAGWPLPGQIKNEWVELVSPLLNVEVNTSPSFCKFRDLLRELAA
jgi:hypothetical protein